MKLIAQRFLNEKLLSGVRSLGVGIALAASLALFFAEPQPTAVVALATGLVSLFAASYTKPTGGNDV